MTVTLDDQPIAVTGGLVQGIPSPYDPAVTVFRGIPYAANPSGQNRFRPPQPVVPWEGVKLADTFGATAPQKAPPPMWFDGLAKQPKSEDCLFLNVWTPTKTTEQQLPVFLWMHGGGFRVGGGADPNYDGTALALKGVIVVTINFRLGILGFLAHPDLSAESGVGASGNYGLLDCIQALQWIQQNISAFGGDPSRVTIGGQSSGSAMTGVLLYSPLTKGLIHRAIFQSGARYPRDPQIACLAPSYRTLKQAEQEGIECLKELGVNSINDLRHFDNLDALVDISLKNDDSLWGPPPFFRSCLDGHVFTQTYEEVLQTGPPNDVPILNGQNHDEGGVYSHPDFTMDDLRECVRERYGPWADRFYELYPPLDELPGRGPLDAWNAAARDNSRINPSMHATEWSRHAKSPVFIYYLTQAPPPYKHNPVNFNVPKSRGYTFFKGPVQGAFHGADFSYTFNSLKPDTDRDWTENDREVGDKISTLWANFIAHGDPNGLSPGFLPKGVPTWPNAVEHPDIVYEIGVTFGPSPLASPEKVEFWKDFLRAQKPW